MSQPHLQLFNCLQDSHSENSGFSLFPLLPPELRLKIWNYSLQRPRIITVRFEVRTDRQVDEDGGSTRYRAIVDGHQVISKLMRVNSEAREAVLSFYRCHIPCTLVHGIAGEEVMKPGTFHFNPEYDFLWIYPGILAKNTLLDFIYHLKHTHDPRRVGLLNLALDTHSLNATDLNLLEPANLNAEHRDAFVDTVSQLREVFFVEKVRTGRQVLGLLSGIPTSETMFNRSFPIMATAPNFERLRRDPRHISEDLKRVYVESDPLGLLHQWQRILKKWDISPSGVEYRLMLSFSPPGSEFPIFDRESAKRWVEKEDWEWTGKWRIDDSVTNANLALRYFDISDQVTQYPIGSLHEKYKNEDLEKAVKPAFGFWLFPMDAFGTLPPEAVSEEAWFRPFTKELLDMTEHWPELGLLSLPRMS